NKNNQLKVTIARNNDRLHIIVQDNGIGIPKEKLITLGKKTQISKKGSGTAIENLVRRLNIIYDGQASLKFESNDSGTCAIVNIPIKN
ncbi:ATP-binding protein, partial [Streptococcus agalactiae]|nr:ATP-binding protein [Streptococcus agalactiae]